MTKTSEGDGSQPQPLPEARTPLDASTSAERSSFTEAIDRRTGSVRARGRLDVRAADMLSGTVQALHRSGCQRIVLDLGGVRAADDAGLDALHFLERRIAADGGHVAVLNRPGAATD